jgi:hypothetical protein
MMLPAISAPSTTGITAAVRTAATGPPTSLVAHHTSLLL